MSRQSILFLVTVALLLLALLLPATAIAHDFEVDGIYYNINGKEATVTYKGMYHSQYSYEYSGDVTIPSIVTYIGTTYSVTTIGESAFSGCSGLTNVTIPNSVTSIGHSAFYGCIRLTSVNIPNSVTTIGESAFSGCSGLTGSLSIPNSVTYIGGRAFSGCSGLTSVTIPNSVTYIGRGAFCYCSGLTNVNIPNTVTSIENSTFYDCTSLTSIDIPNSVTTIGESAFSGCSGLTGSLSIPNSVTFIGSAAFSGCSGLTGSLSIPNAVTTIGESVFSGCSGLTGSLSIPNAVTTIGDYAFSNCSGLTGALTLPNSVTSIGIAAFRGCSSLTSVTIPNSVTRIIDYTFQGCTALDTLYFNAVSCADFSVTANVRPFFNLNISTINIGDDVQKIPAYFAYSLSKLKTLTIGKSVTSIGRSAFQGCTALDTLYFNAVSCADFSSTTSDRPFYNLKNISTINIGDEVQKIPDYFACGFSKLKTLTIPNSVTSIGNYAFGGCTALDTLNFNAVSCADFDFSWSTDHPFFNLNISTITIGDEVEKIPAYFAYGLSKLKTLTIPNSVTSIGGSAFYRCYCLTSVTIPNSVTTIGIDAFSCCDGLTSVTIPNSVTDIGEGAFYYCSGLTNVTIGNSVTTIGDYAFYDCTGLTNVTCMAKTPPSMASSNCFSTYTTTTLYVLRGTLEAYKSANYWYKFYKIYEVDEDGNVLVTSLSLNVTNKVLNVGETFSLRATVAPDVATNRAVQWSSSDNSVATVDSNGQVTAEGVGTANITATTTDGSDLSATCTVTVVRRVTGLTLNASRLDLVLPETVQLVATVTPSNATNGTLLWTSSKTSVATVDDSGLVKSVAPGTATIKATTTDGTNLSASCTVTVTRQYVTGITLSATNITMCKGDTYQLSADVAPSNAFNKALNWSSNSTSVASVDNDGLVTAKAVGTATITAKSTDGSGVSASCIVRVLPDNYMAIDTLTHIRGEAAELVELPLNLINRDEISAIQFDVSLPGCASLGYPEVTLNDARATRSHTISINKLSTNNYRVLIASPQSKNLVGNDGPIAYLNLLLDKNVTTAGNYYLTVSNIIAAGADETRYVLDNTQGLIRYYYIVGDVNADLSVDIADYMATASKILTRTPSPFYSDAADVDQNSSINVTDLVGITNIALGIKPITLRYAPRRDAACDRLTASGLALTAEGRIEVTLDLDAGFDFAAFQMDMSLPQGMMLAGVELGQGAHKLQPVWDTLPDGTVRLLASAFSGADCAGDCPGLLTLKLQANGIYRSQGMLRIHDITFADRHLTSHVLDDVVVDCYGATGIGEVSGAVRIYAEGGKIIVETPEGGTVRLSDIAGHTREYRVTAGRNVLTPWTDGILIISFNNQTIKIKL